MASSSLLGSSIGPDPVQPLPPPSYCTNFLVSTVMGPDVSLPWEEDAGKAGNLVSGPAFTISFLPGHACAVKPFPVLSMTSLEELGLEFGKGLGNISHKAGGSAWGLQAALEQNYIESKK